MIRLGSVPYANALPLIWGIIKKQSSNFSLSYHLPSKLSEFLITSKFDIGMIPVYEAFQNDAFRIIKGCSISSYEQVESVLFYSNKELKDLKTVALDISSKTSINLLKILLQKKHGIKPNYIPIDFRTYEDKAIPSLADGFILIGDQALKRKFSGVEKYDLASEWYNWTGLPFVFAAWITLKDTNIPSLEESLISLKLFGMEHIDQIVEEAKRDLPVTKEQYKNYLTKSIRYDLCEKEIAGLQLYHKYAQELGLAPDNLMLKFYGD